MNRVLTIPLAAALLVGCDDSPQPTEATGLTAAVVTGPTFVGAGDIAWCGSKGDEATARLLDGIEGIVFTLGDNVYEDGTASEFAHCYQPSWGRHRMRTRPSPGNHDYNTPGATAYYDYFGWRAGPTGRGYYSYDVGTWHILSLNSNIPMSEGSPQERWVRWRLRSHPATCTLAYWHHPRFSSGPVDGGNTTSGPIWWALYEAGADLVLVGHEHNYERFAPQRPNARPDPDFGIRQFVVGTGGKTLRTEFHMAANSERFSATGHGVLRLTLGEGNYAWEFVPVPGGTFTDSGTGECHGKPRWASGK